MPLKNILEKTFQMAPRGFCIWTLHVICIIFIIQMYKVYKMNANGKMLVTVLHVMCLFRCDVWHRKHLLCCAAYYTLILPNLLMEIFLRPEHFLNIPCCTSEELFLYVYIIVTQNFFFNELLKYIYIYTRVCVYTPENYNYNIVINLVISYKSGYSIYLHLAYL